MTRRARNPRRRTLRGGVVYADGDAVCVAMRTAPSAGRRKAIYYRASLQFHPDREGGNDVEFKKIQACYEQLDPRAALEAMADRAGAEAAQSAGHEHAGEAEEERRRAAARKEVMALGAGGLAPAAAYAAWVAGEAYRQGRAQAAAEPRPAAAPAAAEPRPAAAAAAAEPRPAAAAAAPARAAAAAAAAAAERRRRDAQRDAEQARKDAVREQAQQAYAERQRAQREARAAAQAAAEPMRAREAAVAAAALRERDARRAAAAEAERAMQERRAAEAEAERMRILENLAAERARNEMLGAAARAAAAAEVAEAAAQRVAAQRRARQLAAAEEEIRQREHAARILQAQYAADLERQRGRVGPFGRFPGPPQRGIFSPYGGGATRRSSLPRLLAMRSSSAKHRMYSRRRRA